MGMLFGGWAREEEEIVRDEYNGDWNAYKEAQEFQRQEAEKNFKAPKTGVYKGIKLTEGDIITPDYKEGKQYLVKDFQEDGVPIVDEISINRVFSNLPYPHEEVFLIGFNLT